MKLGKEEQRNYSRMCFHPQRVAPHYVDEAKHDQLMRELQRLWGLPLDNRLVSSLLDLLNRLVSCTGKNRSFLKHSFYNCKINYRQGTNQLRLG